MGIHRIYFTLFFIPLENNIQKRAGHFPHFSTTQCTPLDIVDFCHFSLSKVYGSTKLHKKASRNIIFFFT